MREAGMVIIIARTGERLWRYCFRVCNDGDGHYDVFADLDPLGDYLRWDEISAESRADLMEKRVSRVALRSSSFGGEAPEAWSEEDVDGEFVRVADVLDVRLGHQDSLDGRHGAFNAAPDQL